LFEQSNGISDNEWSIRYDETCKMKLASRKQRWLRASVHSTTSGTYR